MGERRDHRRVYAGDLVKEGSPPSIGRRLEWDSFARKTDRGMRYDDLLRCPPASMPDAVAEGRAMRVRIGQEGTSWMYA